jgi:COP9 signalosome complex subunit 3
MSGDGWTDRMQASQEKVPRTASNTAILTVKSASKAYDALADAFGQFNNMAKLKAQIKEGRQKWAEDGNSGLVQELIESQLSFAIRRLSGTYSAIPVSNVASNLGADVNELTAYLARLIEERRLNAALSNTGKAGVGIVLRFFLDPTQGPLAQSEKQQQKALLQQTQRTRQLMEQVKSANSRLRLTKEHVDHVKRTTKKTASSGEAMDTSWDVDDGLLDDFDEDVMGDAH